MKKYPFIFEFTIRSGKNKYPGSITLTHNPSWNDYNIFSSYDAVIEYRHSKVKLTNFTKILYEENLSDFAKENYLISKGKKKFIDINKIYSSFQLISQTQDIEFYDKLISTLGKNTALRFLKKINDAGIIRKLSDVRFFGIIKLTSSPQFLTSLIRENSAYYAYAEGFDLFFGKSRVDKKLPKIEIDFNLQFFDNNHHLLINYSNENIWQKNRIALLIGPNGTGKSQCLKHIAEDFLGVRRDRENIKLKKKEMGVSRVLLFSNLAYDNFYPKDVVAVRKTYQDYLYVNLTKEDHKNTITESLCKILNNQKTKFKFNKYSYLKEVLKKYIDFDDILLPTLNDWSDHKLLASELTKQKGFSEIKSVNMRSHELKLLKSGKEVFLSTGQAIFFRILLRLLSFVKPGTLILFDEPETYLHPSLEVEFMNVLDNVLIETDSVALISTHSVFIAREVPKENVYVLRKLDKKSLIDHPHIQTFGGNLDSIASYVFGDFDFVKPHEEAIDELIKKEGAQNFLEKNQGHLSSELIMKIK